MATLPRVVVADDHAALRSALCRSLALQGDFDVVGEASNNDEAIEVCQQEAPNILLLDMGMSGPATIEVVRTLKQSLPELRVVILSAEDAPRDLGELLSAGVDGYLVKGDPAGDLDATLAAVARGEKRYSGSIREGFRPDETGLRVESSKVDRRR